MDFLTRQIGMGKEDGPINEADRYQRPTSGAVHERRKSHEIQRRRWHGNPPIFRCHQAAGDR
jgi:hypothetical protein